MVDIGGWLKAIQLPARHLFAIALLGVLLLGLPPSYAKSLHITTLTDSYRWLLTLITGAASVFWVAQMVPTVARWVRESRSRRVAIAHIATLGEFERVVLAHCLVNNARTVTVYFHHAVAQSLMGKGLLEFAGSSGASAMACPFTIPNHVWKYLRTHPDEVVKGLSAMDDEKLQGLHKYFVEIRDMPWWARVK
ncbi:MAG: super-infection exclusion protein B [candidate division WOR-3 bacterium]|nr:super-infection exclusion protein B [candidate division WOR-3 bacterium]